MRMKEKDHKLSIAHHLAASISGKIQHISIPKEDEIANSENRKDHRACDVQAKGEGKNVRRLSQLAASRPNS